MTIAYVLITILHSYEQEVNNKLSKIIEIIELYPLLGEYDFIVKFEADGYEKLMEILINKIRPIEGIIDTKTLTRVKF